MIMGLRFGAVYQNLLGNYAECNSFKELWLKVKKLIFNHIIK